jgi:ubiquinone/menaquinone biosynthesis C-methylase UbiE
MKPNFNIIASFYDFLVRMVFGSTLWEAQRLHLSIVKPADRVLIIGGGTGRILSWLPLDCQITYVEPSSNMIRLAKRRGNRSVEFVQSDYLNYSDDVKYDIIICPFVLDVFAANELERVLEKLKGQLSEDGKLMVTDFRQTKHWNHKMLIKVMLLFFRWTANLRVAALQPIQNRLEASSFTRISTKSYRNGLIFSDLYKIQ